MAKRTTAGILVYRQTNNSLEVFLVHPGGPFWAKKEVGAWSIPKGEIDEHELPLDAARREFEEETGIRLSGRFIPLTPITQKAGKKVFAWALEAEIDAAAVQCSTWVKVHWPPNSGKWITIPEVDKGQWFSRDEAKNYINPAQIALIDELAEILKNKGKENE